MSIEELLLKVTLNLEEYLLKTIQQILLMLSIFVTSELGPSIGAELLSVPEF
jgi:TctA family transporter